jgi:hypothetical protein
MVRPAATVLQPNQLQCTERHSPPRRRMATGHEFPHARRLQADSETDAVHIECV